MWTIPRNVVSYQPVSRVPTILVHGGAGAYSQELRSHADEVRRALEDVLEAAARQLEDGDTALDVVTAAVRAMESCELFNAGHGSALCDDGTVELSAALMRGSDRVAGAVAGLRTTAHPIDAAALVLDSDQVLMVGDRADELAEERGLEQWENSAFITEKQRARLLASPIREENRGTVGAVCLDSSGELAAATSTGGITGQPPGRVGDSPLIGAGTWADSRVAISCTGDGEAFVRAGASRWLAAVVEAGTPLDEAARRALEEVASLGGRGGLIALDRDGGWTMPFTTAAMPRGIWRAGDRLEIGL
jgi:beta-aspartyl-peptidase (threonine type)